MPPVLVPLVALAVATASPSAVSGPYSAVSFDRDLRQLATVAPWHPSDAITSRDDDEDVAGWSGSAFDETGAGDRVAPDAACSEPSAFLDAGPAAATTINTLSAPLVDVEGIGFTGTGPPDTVGAAGPQHVVQMVNEPTGAALAIYDKSGARIVGPTSFTDFWPSGACHDAGRGDPIALFDPLANRWLLSQLGVPTSCFLSSTDCHLCIAISKSTDPVTGGWWLYDVTVDAFPDYPKYGVWPDAYYVGVNQVERVAGQVVQRVGAWALDRSRMLLGQPTTLQRFSQPPLSGFFFQGLMPATVQSGVPPAGAPGIFLRHRDAQLHGPAAGTAGDALELWQLHLSWTEPASSTLSGPTALPLASFSSAVPNILQGNGVGLLPRQEPLMWPLGYRRLGTDQRLVGSFTVAAPSPGAATTRWFELASSNGVWSVGQEGSLAADDADRWMSSASADQAGNLAVAYSVAGNVGTFPGIRYGGRRAADPIGALTQPERTIASGLAWQANGPWGDYGSLSLDPSDGCTFWSTQQYVRSDGLWGTRLAAFRFTDCVAVTPPPSCIASDTTLCLGDRFAVSATWKTAVGNSGVAQVQKLTSDSGYLYFFQASNIEALVKVLDGCGVNGNHWVFAAGLTDVAVDLRVEDTNTGQVRKYRNDQGVAFRPIQDTKAFGTCP